MSLVVQGVSGSPWGPKDQALLFPTALPYPVLAVRLPGDCLWAALLVLLSLAAGSLCNLG